MSLHVYQAGRSTNGLGVYSPLLQGQFLAAGAFTQDSHTVSGLGVNGAEVSEGNKFGVFAECRTALNYGAYQESFSRLGAFQYTFQQGDTISGTIVTYINAAGLWTLAMPEVDGDGDIESIATCSYTQADNTLSARAIPTGEAVATIVQDDQTISATGTAPVTVTWVRVTPSDSTWTSVTPSDSTWTTV